MATFAIIRFRHRVMWSQVSPSHYGKPTDVVIVDAGWYQGTKNPTPNFASARIMPLKTAQSMVRRWARNEWQQDKYVARSAEIITIELEEPRRFSLDSNGET